MATRLHSASASDKHVRAEEDGAPAIAQRQDQIAHFAPAKRIEARHRLVEKHHFGIVDERLRDADALDHALRELPQRQPPLAGDADLSSSADTRRAPLGAVVAEQAWQNSRSSSSAVR